MSRDEIGGYAVSEFGIPDDAEVVAMLAIRQGDGLQREVQRTVVRKQLAGFAKVL
ncbi:MAG TPA: hypothetical protein VGN86_07395 [Pyrinomonadaceae bacterium]|jgi:hypothetical protein|nr:hypothetical protein [Pyrinomonadaceae bacterium]